MPQTTVLVVSSFLILTLTSLGFLFDGDLNRGWRIELQRSLSFLLLRNWAAEDWRGWAAFRPAQAALNAAFSASAILAAIMLATGSGGKSKRKKA